jgi:hypothetical protein
MALSTVTVSVKHVWSDGVMLHVLGLIAIQASPGTYPSNGFTLSLSDPLIKAQRAPKKVHVYSHAKQNGQTQYDYTYVTGTDNTNGKLKIFTGGAELAAAATPSGVSGDTIAFEALFLGQN